MIFIRISDISFFPWMGSVNEFAFVLCHFLHLLLLRRFATDFGHFCGKWNVLDIHFSTDRHWCGKSGFSSSRLFNQSASFPSEQLI
jgi:hypothetical protein